QGFTVAPDSCHTIQDVIVDGAPQGPVTHYTFNDVQGNHTISASFTLITYTITASAGAGGSISPSGSVSVNCGADQGFAITADPGSAIQDVLVDAVSQGAIASYPFTNVQANHTISAIFAENVPPEAAVLDPNGGETLIVGAPTTSSGPRATTSE